MSPVTSQGIRAQAAMNERVNETRPRILELLRVDDLSPAALVGGLSDTPAEIVREAMWQLIDGQEIELTAAMDLHLQA
jgi:hypothetical protein